MRLVFDVIKLIFAQLHDDATPSFRFTVAVVWPHTRPWQRYSLVMFVAAPWQRVATVVVEGRSAASHPLSVSTALHPVVRQSPRGKTYMTIF